MAHDGQATAIAVEEVEGTVPDIQGFDPMVLRWYINTTVRDMVLDGQRVKDAILRYGKFHPVTRFNTRQEFHSIDEQAPREQEVTRTAQSAQVYLEECLSGKDEFGNRVQGKRDRGLKVDFYGETDAGKMAVISRTLLPSLPEIRDICEVHSLTCPISPTCDGQDDLDFGERETCPTCWLQWAVSPACEAYMLTVAKEGMSVYNANEPDTERIVRPRLPDLEKARDLVITSLQTGITALQAEWSQMIGEIDKGERKGFDEAGYQHGIRKDIHQTAPDQRQLEMVRQFARESARPAGNPAGDQAMERVVSVLDRMDQRLARLEGPVAPETPAPVPPAAKPQAIVEQPEEIAVESSPAEDLAGPAKRMEQAKNKKGETSHDRT